MLFLLEDKSLSIVDWFQIMSAVGTVAAAIFAMITTIQNRKANKELQLERHMMVKPAFKIKTTYEMRLEKKIEIGVINLGFNRVMNSVEGGWNGTNGVKVSVKEIVRNDGKNNELQITLNYSECIEKNIKGTLSISYANILGKPFEESVTVEINSIYNDLQEEYLILKEGLFGQNFI